MILRFCLLFLLTKTQKNIAVLDLLICKLVNREYITTFQPNTQHVFVYNNKIRLNENCRSIKQ